MQRMKKNERGITLISLVITIIVLLILASIGIGTLIDDSGIIKNVEIAKLSTDYQHVKESLELYKLQKESNSAYEEVTDESLIGTIFKKVFIEDTKRELAVLVNFDEIGIKPTYGEGGKKILKDDNNDMSTTKEVNTLYELGNIYAIDLEDGSLYYINGEQLYSLVAEKVEVAENETTVEKYLVETPSIAYTQKRKFITKWNVTLGETEGSTTYSTVVLPISSSAKYDATIYWGDGTSTTLKHGIDGTTLTNQELIEKVTHNYTLSQSDDAIRTIEISGIYANFSMKGCTSSPTKLKLVGLEQWGNTDFKNVNFKGTNLTGNIPAPNLKDCFEKCTSFDSLFADCSKITSLSEDFNIPSNITVVSNLFYGCSGLTKLPEKFLIPEGVTSLYNTFKGCNSLTKLPDNFKITNNVTEMKQAFQNCSSLTKLPDDFSIPSNAKNLESTFAQCTSLTSLPENFTIPNGVTSMTEMFANCKIESLPNSFILPSTVKNMKGTFQNTSLKSLPEDFVLPDSVTDISSLFSGCKIESLPEGFIIPNSVINMASMFQGSSLKSLPDNFTIPDSVQDMNSAFYNCQITSLPDNFRIGNSVKYMQFTFRQSKITDYPQYFTIPDSVENMRMTFYNSSLTTLPSDFKIGNSVKDMDSTFAGCSKFTTLPDNLVIPESVTTAISTFSTCLKLKGTITIRANLQQYTSFFASTAIGSGGILTVNYSSNCTNINDIIATGNGDYIKIGDPVD